MIRTVAKVRAVIGLLAAAGATAGTISVAAPVQAASNPHYTWGIVSGTVYFNHAETRYMAGGANATTALARTMPERYSKAILSAAAYVSGAAADADGRGFCLKVKSYGVAGGYRGTDGDGYCR